MITSAVDNTTADPLIGATIAQYEVVARLGGGGMGIVYSARDTKLGRRVALKFLPPRWSHDDSAKQRFIREAQAASATDHRNICTIHDIETAADGQLFIVMAHYDGQTLKQRLESGAMPIDEAVEIAAQVAEGLAKAHAQGVIHRDIKPGNLILTEDGVKILDFGLAKLAAESLRLTLEGTTIGTVAYMSPEQARGDEADPRSDIWALGVVFYEMLAGRPPFRGAYAEAIAHAIRHDTPAPLRLTHPESSEALERIVFQALHKDPEARRQSARELARDLRLLQGRTMPLELRTEPLPRRDAAPALTVRDRPFWTFRKVMAAAAVVVALSIGAPLWMLAPVERIPVAVAPVVNQTGYAELDDYRLALTDTLIRQLGSTRDIRVMPYDRLLQIVRRFRTPGSDVSSREAIQSLTMNSGARVVIVPTLVNDNGGWTARVEFRDTATATTTAAYETPVVVSSLMKETVYGLMTPLATAVQDHFAETGPRRAYLANLVRKTLGRTPATPAPHLRTLDAEADFAQGLDRYEQQEYSGALRAFTSAAQRDPRSPMPPAWSSRTLRVMRRDREAADAAQAAIGLMSEATTETDRLFIQAVAAEARREPDVANARYHDLVARAPDDAVWAEELAAFEDRQGRVADAIAAQHQALALDPRLLRPHLDLCRLYNPNELAAAREHGEQALKAYRALGARAAEAQSLWCLADVLRLGAVADVRQARANAGEALTIFQSLNYPYNLARAYNYVALAAGAQGRWDEATQWWERSLAAARDVGNAALQPLVTMNLAVVNVRRGDRAAALEYYRQSARGFETLGQEQRAAELKANAAAILIDNSGDPEQGFRDVQNALAVSRKLGNRNFEVLDAQLTAAYYRYGGRQQDAERELNRALALARERDLKDDVASLTTDLARSRLESGDYAGARTLLTQAVAVASGGDRTHARIRLGETYLGLGDAAAAQREFAIAEMDLRSGADAELVPVLEAAMGELAYQSGRPDAARPHFVRAAALWTDGLPDAASVEARAYLGMMDALDGRTDAGVAQVTRALEQATKMARVSLQARCRMFLARIAAARHRFDDALRELDQIPADDASRTIAADVRSQVEALRDRVLAARPDRRRAG